MPCWFPEVSQLGLGQKMAALPSHFGNAKCQIILDLIPGELHGFLRSYMIIKHESHQKEIWTWRLINDTSKTICRILTTIWTYITCNKSHAAYSIYHVTSATFMTSPEMLTFNMGPHLWYYGYTIAISVRTVPQLFLFTVVSVKLENLHESSIVVSVGERCQCLVISEFANYIHVL